MFRFTEGSRVSAIGAKLHTLACVPSKPKAGLVWLHGFAEHSGRYRKVFSQLAEAGIASYSFDHYGHGRSEPTGADERTLLTTFWHLVDDAQAYAAEVRVGEAGGMPWFLGGHSMGGLLACHLALRDQALWQGLILCGAAVDVEWTPILRLQASVGNLLAKLVPRANIVPAVKVKHISSDPKTREEYVADKLIVVGNVRARSGNEILAGMRGMQRSQHKLALPILALHGTQDHISDIKAMRRLIATCASKDKELVDFEGSYHELLTGPEAARALPLIQDWVQAHLQGAPAKL